MCLTCSQRNLSFSLLIQTLPFIQLTIVTNTFSTHTYVEFSGSCRKSSCLIWNNWLIKSGVHCFRDKWCLLTRPFNLIISVLSILSWQKKPHISFWGDVVPIWWYIFHIWNLPRGARRVMWSEACNFYNPWLHEEFTLGDSGLASVLGGFGCPSQR